MDPINLYEYEALAQARLTTMAYDYYASGAHDEITPVSYTHLLRGARDGRGGQ